MTVRFARITIVIGLLIASGCVRHAAVQDFGGIGPARQAAPSSDTSLRAIFRQQTKGAVAPIADDARIQAFELRLKNNPSDSVARLELAAIYEGYRLYDDALEQYTAAFDVLPSEKAIFGISKRE